MTNEFYDVIGYRLLILFVKTCQERQSKPTPNLQPKQNSTLRREEDLDHLSPPDLSTSTSAIESFHYTS
jgi:hypothetical protein